jgi:hypothetical protein
MKLYPKKLAHEAIFEDGAAYERFMGRWSWLTGHFVFRLAADFASRQIA